MVEMQIYFILLLLPEKIKLVLICKTERQLKTIGEGFGTRLPKLNLLPTKECDIGPVLLHLPKEDNSIHPQKLF